MHDQIRPVTADGRGRAAESERVGPGLRLEVSHERRAVAERRRRDGGGQRVGDDDDRLVAAGAGRGEGQAIALQADGDQSAEARRLHLRANIGHQVAQVTIARRGLRAEDEERRRARVDGERHPGHGPRDRPRVGRAARGGVDDSAGRVGGRGRDDRGGRLGHRRGGQEAQRSTHGRVAEDPREDGAIRRHRRLGDRRAGRRRDPEQSGVRGCEGQERAALGADELGEDEAGEPGALQQPVEVGHQIGERRVVAREGGRERDGAADVDAREHVLREERQRRLDVRGDLARRIHGHIALGRSARRRRRRGADQLRGRNRRRRDGGQIAERVLAVRVAAGRRLAGIEPPIRVEIDEQGDAVERRLPGIPHAVAVHILERVSIDGVEAEGDLEAALARAAAEVVQGPGAVVRDDRDARRAGEAELRGDQQLRSLHRDRDLTLVADRLEPDGIAGSIGRAHEDRPECADDAAEQHAVILVR